MISHCVFVRYSAATNDATRDAIHAALRALQPRIPGLDAIHIARNSSPEGLDKGHSDGFIVEFRDAAARDQYLVDEEHAKVGAMIVAAAEGGVDGIFVYDLEH